MLRPHGGGAAELVRDEQAANHVKISERRGQDGGKTGGPPLTDKWVVSWKTQSRDDQLRKLEEKACFTDGGGAKLFERYKAGVR